MTDDELIEIAIQGHASTRDAMRYAIQQEREACAKVCEDEGERIDASWMSCAAAIRARGDK